MLLQIFQTNIFKVFYFSFMKQRKQPKDSAVTITLPVIPDVPPPGAGVLPVGVPDVPDAYNSVMSEIFL